MKHDNSDKNLSIYIESLNQHMGQLYSYIIRKETAVWSAIVLYFAVVSVVIFKILDVGLKPWSLPHFGVLFAEAIFAFLFYLFIKSQYRRVQNNMLLIKILNKVIHDSIRKNKIAVNFKFEKWYDRDSKLNIHGAWPREINKRMSIMLKQNNVLPRGGGFGRYYYRLMKEFYKSLFTAKKKRLNEYSEQEAIVIVIFSYINGLIILVTAFQNYLIKWNT